MNSEAAYRFNWRDVVVFCSLAYGLSWLWWAPMVLPKLAGLSLTGPLPDLAKGPSVGLLGFGMFGPLIAAVVMRLFISREGVRGSLGMIRPWYWNVTPFWHPVFSSRF